MTPTSVKQYLQRRGIAPMVDVVNRFEAEPAAAAAILDFWIRKGRLRHIPAASAMGGSACATSSCGGCRSASCTPGYDASRYALGDLFEWVGLSTTAALSLDAFLAYGREQERDPAHLR